ncbi:MAG: hypothetical protein LBS07_04735, partial [Prevotellaceae bacterium]|nr:hypothetical protein [Prevotellaceae bacterium]
TIFLPAPGYRDSNGELQDVGSTGFYWSRNVYGKHTAFLEFAVGSANWNYGSRSAGKSIRPVKK